MPPAASLVPPGLAEAAARAVDRARAGGRPALLSWTAPAPGADALRALAAMEAPRAFFAAPDGDAMAAAGEAAVVEAEGAARFDAVRIGAEALLAGAEVLAPEGAPGPRLVGGFAFADRHAAEGLWEGFPGARMVLPRVAVVASPRGAWTTVNRLVEGREDAAALARHMARAAADAAAPSPFPAPAEPGVPLPAFGARVVDRGAWEAEVAAALAAIRAGALEKVVLARRVAVPLTAPLGGAEALARLAGPYGDCFRFLVEPRAGRAFLGATPERLVRVRGPEVLTAAVAGSAPRGATPADDAAAAEALRASPKERREHAIVVEHLRAALADLGAKVGAAPAPEVLRLRNVQHLHTPLRAELPTRTHALDVAAALHPTPAVGGSPARAALAFLEGRESFARGWYAGAVGWFDARGDGEFAVALRCARLDPDEAWLFAGAGIVAGAEAAREWEETVLKLQPMLEALGERP